MNRKIKNIKKPVLVREPKNKTFLIWFNKAVLDKKIYTHQQKEIEAFFKSQGLAETETLECYDSFLQKY